MSIVTRTGDTGTTGLLFGRRIAKYDTRVEAIGAVDEFSAVLGLARTALAGTDRAVFLETVQRRLVLLMGELALDSGDRDRKLAFAPLDAAALAELDDFAAGLEPTLPPFREWDLSGTNERQARLHVARTVCRRAERAVWALAEVDPAQRVFLPQYLNRLSDVLWLLAREAEDHSTGA